MVVLRVAAVLCLLLGPAPLLASRSVLVTQAHSPSAGIVAAKSPGVSTALRSHTAGAPAPANAAAHAPGPAARAPKSAPKGAHLSTAHGRKLQESWYNAFSAKDLAAIFGTADESAPPALIAPEADEVPAPAPAAAAAAAAATAPNLAPAGNAHVAHPPGADALAPSHAPAAAPRSPRATYPPTDTIAPTDLMSLFAGYTPEEGGKAGAGGRKLQSFADVFSPAELEAIFGPPDEEEADAPAPGSAAATAAAPAPSAAGRAAGRQLRQISADDIVTEDEILQKALNVALADTQAEIARTDFENTIEQVAVAPGPNAPDSLTRRRLQQDYNAPDFPRAIFDMAMKLAPSYDPVQPEAAGAPRPALVPMAIPTRGLLQDDPDDISALEDLVSPPDAVFPVSVEVDSTAAPAPAPAPAAASEDGVAAEAAPSIQ
ncbi:g5533 [Coccomyxa elongata]